MSGVRDLAASNAAALAAGALVFGLWTTGSPAARPSSGWPARSYVAAVPTRFGRPTLRLRFAQTLDHRGSGPLRHAYVDRVLLERVSE